MLAGSDPQCRTSSNQSRVLLPPGLVILYKLVEDEHTEKPEASKAAVVDDVEDSDEEPRHGSPTHDGTRVLVVHEPGEGLPAMSLHGLDGGGSDRKSLVGHLVSLSAPSWLHLTTPM